MQATASPVPSPVDFEGKFTKYAPWESKMKEVTIARLAFALRSTETKRSAVNHRSASAGAIAILVIAATLASCKPGTFLKLHRNVSEMSNTVFLTGDVSHAEADSKSVVVFALQDDAKGVSANNYAHLAGPNRFVLRLEPGHQYTVGAFADRNANLRPDPGEPFGLYREVFLATRENRIPRIALAVEDGAAAPERLAGALADLSSIEQKAFPIVIGELTTLDDERFTMELGIVGLWAPFDYAVQVGTGVYFLEPYDPKKIPIVFVSGAGGYPRQWKTLIAHLDRTKYQPWVYAYPSGLRLDEAARILNGVMNELQVRYRFERAYVTAHSMGGLVARGFIQRNVHQDNRYYVRLLVTMATPWLGHKAAWMGVELSPATVPSWIDMQEDSDYQKSIFAQPFGSNVAYYLFFAHVDVDYEAEGADDGTVSVASQLRSEAVREANEVLGFLGDHDAVLSSDVSLTAYTRILDQADRRK